MSTTDTTTTANAEPTIKVQIPDNTGHTEIFLTIRAAADRALKEVKESAKWIFCSAKDIIGSGLEPIIIDGKSDGEAIDYLIGVFGNSNEVLITEKPYGGYGDPEGQGHVIQDADADEVAEESNEIIGNVRIVYVDDIDGRSAIPRVLKYVPQLVVEVSPDNETTVYVRNTDKSIDKVVSNAALIFGALSKIEADDARP